MSSARSSGPFPEGPARRLEEGVFRLLTRLYPSRFRDRYGPELMAFFRAERSRPRHRGLVGAARFWRHTIRDLSAASVRGRARSIPSGLLMRLSELPRHLKLSLRSLAKEPGLGATVTLTLAVGIAATLVVFTLVDAALLEAIPFEDGDRMVFVRGTLLSDRQDTRGASLQEIRAWAEGAPGLAALSAVSGRSVNLDLGDGVRQLVTEFVMPSYFDVVDVGPVRGRLFGDEDDRVAGGHPVAVISETLWEEQFDRSPDIVGTSVLLNDTDFTVIGVLPERFGGVNLNTEVWLPIMMSGVVGMDPAELGWSQRWLIAVGRLADGVSMEEAQSQVDAVALALSRERPDSNEDRTGTLTSARALYLGPAEDMLLVLLGASGILLLVAVTNAAGLLTVRSMGRRDEYAMRLALGAGRGRIVVRALVDAVVLAALAAGVSWILARWALAALLANLPAGALPPFVAPRLDAGVLAFAAGIVLLAALLSGLLPALQSSRGDITSALRDVRTSTAGGERGPWGSPQQLLVVAEVAIAVVLLVGTGLTGRTLLNLIAVDQGFDPAGLSVVRVRLAGERFQDRAALRGFAERARARLLEEPGVQAVSYGSDVPLRGGSSAGILALDPARPEDGTRYYRHRVAANYRELLGMRLLAGRDLTELDVDGTPPVVQVSREFAERLLGGVEAALGHELLLSSGSETPATIVGVVDSVRWRDLTTDVAAGEDDPDVYIPFAQSPIGRIELVLRTAPGVDLALPGIREAVADVDPDTAAFLLASMEDQLRLQTAGNRLTVTVLAAFAISALLLAAIGVYGALASAVAHRRREIAIRMALGATVRAVRRSVLGRGLRLAALGAAAGSLVAVGLGRFLAGMLYGVSGTDVPTYATVVALLLGVALAATWVPAHRATRIDPQKAL